MKRLLLLLAVCVAVPSSWADRRDDDRRDNERRGRGPRVIVYQHADYRGNSLVFYPGDVLENLADVRFENGGPLNDSISSIRVEDGAEIYVYDNSRFRGQVMRLTENARDLSGRLLPGSVSANWSDRISSLRVERVEERRRGDGPRADPELIIKKAYQDLLLREPDPTGLRSYRGLIIDQGWTEQMVRDHIRRGDEFRREGADRIIRRAYLDVLGREPDPSGLKQYRRALLEKDWTESDLRDELRRSEEFRKKSGGR